MAVDYNCSSNFITMGYNPTDSQYYWESSSVPNVRHISIPFQYNTPKLFTGLPVYTPAIGECLLNAWIEITNVWTPTVPAPVPANYTLISNVYISPRAYDGINTSITFCNPGVLSYEELIGASLVPIANTSAMANGQITFTTANPLTLFVCWGLNFAIGPLGGPFTVDPVCNAGSAVLHLLIGSTNSQ